MEVDACPRDQQFGLQFWEAMSLNEAQPLLRWVPASPNVCVPNPTRNSHKLLLILATLEPSSSVERLEGLRSGRVIVSTVSTVVSCHHDRQLLQNSKPHTPQASFQQKQDNLYVEHRNSRILHVNVGAVYGSPQIGSRTPASMLQSFELMSQKSQLATTLMSTLSKSYTNIV